MIPEDEALAAVRDMPHPDSDALDLIAELLEEEPRDVGLSTLMGRLDDARRILRETGRLR